MAWVEESWQDVRIGDRVRDVGEHVVTNLGPRRQLEIAYPQIEVALDEGEPVLKHKTSRVWVWREPSYGPAAHGPKSGSADT